MSCLCKYNNYCDTHSILKAKLTHILKFYISWCGRFRHRFLNMIFYFNIRTYWKLFPLQPKWNDALLEKFRIEYVGTSPYITCLPSLYHYRLGPKDRFLILASDGLYEYLSNEEAVSQVEYFIAKYPKGDPAQHLILQVLCQAAEKHGNLLVFMSET